MLLYTRRTWGKDQRDTYKQELDSRLDYLKSYPLGGPPRVDLYPTCRMLQAGGHIFYYRLREDAVRVVRVLHENADPSAPLNRVREEFE